MMFRNRLLMTCAVAPVAIVAGVAMSGVIVTIPSVMQPAFAACNPCAVTPCNPVQSLRSGL